MRTKLYWLCVLVERQEEFGALITLQFAKFWLGRNQVDLSTPVYTTIQPLDTSKRLRQAADMLQHGGPRCPGAKQCQSH